jgi:hypothetical protein
MPGTEYRIKAATAKVAPDHSSRLAANLLAAYQILGLSSVARTRKPYRPSGGIFPQSRGSNSNIGSTPLATWRIKSVVISFSLFHPLLGGSHLANRKLVVKPVGALRLPLRSRVDLMNRSTAALSHRSRIVPIIREHLSGMEMENCSLVQLQVPVALEVFFNHSACLSTFSALVV